MLNKDEFVRRMLDDQRRHKLRETKRRADWYAYQSDKGVRIRARAWRGAGRSVAR